VTASLMLIALLATAATLGAHLGRGALQLTLTYLALRNTTPSQRTQILHALTPALAATTGSTPPPMTHHTPPCSTAPVVVHRVWHP
jgi:hypothetical protein